MILFSLEYFQDSSGTYIIQRMMNMNQPIALPNVKVNGIGNNYTFTVKNEYTESAARQMFRTILTRNLQPDLEVGTFGYEDDLSQVSSTGYLKGFR